MIEVESYLQGTWVGCGGRAVELVDPSTEATVGRVSAERLELGPVADHARRVGGPALRALTFAERGEILGALSKAIRAQREALIDVSVATSGTTRADAKFDIDGAIGTLAFYASLGAKLGQVRHLAEPVEQLGQDSRFFGQHVWLPRRGVALHINAFNFPAWGLAEKLATSILAGMPVITKPATSTSIVAYRVARAIVEANALPSGAFHFVVGSVTEFVEELGPQDVIAFTGSAETAAKLRSARSVRERSTRLNVEADSLNSAVLAPNVTPDDDVYRTFLRDVIKEMTQKTGQKCTATRRIFVPRALVDRVEEDLAAELGRVTVGHPALDEVRMGPLATRQQREDFRAGVASLVASGARVVFGSPTEVAPIGVPDGKGFFVSPVLLRADAPERADAVHEREVFGPCATLCPYDEVAGCVDLVARGGGGLVSTVYGDDRSLLEMLVTELGPHHGRLLIVSGKVADKTISPGLVLPSCVHGGPGRAGGGEELGGERGLRLYMQRTAVQGDRALLDKFFSRASAGA